MNNNDSRTDQNIDEDVFYLKPGYIYIGSEKTAVKTVLGNCVSVCLWDDKLRYGGMNHFLYPFTKDKKKATAKFGNIATKILIKKMYQFGTKKENLVAQIIGGAKPENTTGIDLGTENISIARKILHKEGIKIKSEDVGGHLGRKVVFDMNNGHLLVIKVHKIRSGDWKTYSLDDNAENIENIENDRS